MKNNRKLKKSNDDSLHCQLCFSLVSTGYCKYGDKCCFIHDNRIYNKNAPKVSSKVNDKLDRDCKFYWPNNKFQIRNQNLRPPNIYYEVDTTHGLDKYTEKIWKSFLKFTESQYD